MQARSMPILSIGRLVRWCSVRGLPTSKAIAWVSSSAALMRACSVLRRWVIFWGSGVVAQSRPAASAFATPEETSLGSMRRSGRERSPGDQRSVRWESSSRSIDFLPSAKGVEMDLDDLTHLMGVATRENPRYGNFFCVGEFEDSSISLGKIIVIQIEGRIRVFKIGVRSRLVNEGVWTSVIGRSSA